MEINSSKCLIFRITHIENVPWILDNGLHCRNSPVCDPSFRDIGNPDLIGKRAHREVPIPPGGTLSDYVPFYFTPYSPMLLNIRTGYNGMKKTPMPDIAILVSSLRTVADNGIPFVFTDRHAYVRAARFSSDLADLHQVDWKILQNRDFKRDPNDLGKAERYQAEALIHRFLPVTALLGIACHGTAQEESVRAEVEARSLSLTVVTRPGWYF
jgi:hypothetical protein